VRVKVRDSLGRGGCIDVREPVSCGEGSAEMGKQRRPGPEWDVTEDEWVGCEAAAEGVEIRGRYT
jgi:hypothetical protein